jgi:hypothetical protein
MRRFELGDVIAERRLTFKADAGWSREVDVRIGRPIPDPSQPGGGWVCTYQILGLGHDRVMGIFGADSVQALLLAVHTIPAELAAFMRDPGGRFLHHGHVDATFLAACRVTLENAGGVPPCDEQGDTVPKASVQPSERFFLNVDLDVDSSEDLGPLAAAFEPVAYSLERPFGHASFELNVPVSPVEPEPLILEFVRLVIQLPSSAREIWDRASRRVFDIGIQSGRRPFRETYRLAPGALRAAADVGAEIAVTVYPLDTGDQDQNLG